MINPKRVILAHTAKILFDQAKKHFGTTTDFSKGAWLLPDGDLLDFSREKGRLDHSDIIKIFPEELKEQDLTNYVPEKDFIRNRFLDSGAIRLVAEGGGIEITKEPTPQQLTKVSEFLEWLPNHDFFIDLSGKGNPFRQMYENNPEERSKVVNTIERYFKGQLRGVSELQKYRYSDNSHRYLRRKYD